MQPYPCTYFKVNWSTEITRNALKYIAGYRTGVKNWDPLPHNLVHFSLKQTFGGISMWLAGFGYLVFNQE